MKGLLFVLLLISIVLVSGCTSQPANIAGNNSNPASSNQVNSQPSTNSPKASTDLSSDPNCPPRLNLNPVITSDLQLDYPLTGYGSGFDQLGTGYSHFFYGSGCYKGSEAGQNLNDYYCELESPCLQMNNSDGTIEGYVKVKYIVDYETLNVTHWTEYNQKIDFTYNWYNITLKAKDCSAEKIVKDTLDDCFNANFT